MPIPTHKEIMPELLKMANNVDTFRVHDFIEPLSQAFNLTEEEKKQWYASKNTTIFTDRASWAKSYLKMSGMLEPISRGVFKITPLGKDSLTLSSEELVKNVIDAVRERGVSNKQEKEVIDNKTDLTPDEMLENGYSQIKENLRADLIDKVMEMSPDFFERLVVKLLKNMGYGDPVQGEWTVTQGTNDEGIDGIIKEDALGLEVIYIQAKRWKNPVGRPEIQKFAGALLGKNAKKGVFITTSNYSTGAMDYAQSIDTKLVLINGAELASYMIDYNVGVSKVNTFHIKAIDTDFFEE